MVARWWWLALGLNGCAYRQSDYVDGQGSAICLTTEPLADRVKDGWTGQVPVQDEGFVPGEKVWVNVLFHRALGECDRLEAADCSLGFDGTDVAIEASAEVAWRKDRTACDGPIEPALTSCQTVALEEDTWTFAYGDVELILEVPSTVETPCTEIEPPIGCQSAPFGASLPMAGIVALLLGRRRRKGTRDDTVLGAGGRPAGRRRG
jgi:uncharacterized protein (TIGR03382 family)